MILKLHPEVLTCKDFEREMWQRWNHTFVTKNIAISCSWFFCASTRTHIGKVIYQIFGLKYVELVKVSKLDHNLLKKGREHGLFVNYIVLARLHVSSETLSRTQQNQRSQDYQEGKINTQMQWSHFICCVCPVFFNIRDKKENIYIKDLVSCTIKPLPYKGSLQEFSNLLWCKFSSNNFTNER